MKKTIILIIAILMLSANFIVFSTIKYESVAGAPTFTPSADVYVDDNAAPEWYDATHVHKIQEGVTNASSGQSIYVYGGTYPETLSGSAYITIASKSLTIVGQQDDMPIINPSMATSKQIFSITGSRNTVTLQYLNISNAAGSTISGDIAVLTGSASNVNNLFVDHCIIHDIEWAVKTYGNVTVTNCTIRNIKYAVESGSPTVTFALLFNVTHNIIYDSPAVTGELIRPKGGNYYGNISYNYISGSRIPIWLDPEGIPASSYACAYGGNWTVSHNTITSRYNPSNPGNASQGISLASVKGNFDRITIRDNIIDGANYYSIIHSYAGTGPYSTHVNCSYNLFNNSYWEWWPDAPNYYQRYFQWNGTGISTNVKYPLESPHTIIGWGDNTTTGYTFNISNCIVGSPKFNLTGTAGPQYWGLQYGSPAYHTASDGTNIGAWQGTTFPPAPSNNPPDFGTPSPTNGSTGQNLSLTWSIPINDAEGNSFRWFINCSNGQTASASGASNGTKSLSISGLSKSTTYKVYVNASDIGSGQWTRDSYTFTTNDSYVYTVLSFSGRLDVTAPPEPPNPPTNETLINGTAYAQVYNATLGVFVSDQDSSTLNVSFYWGNDTLIHTIEDVANGTVANLSLYLYHHPYQWLAHDTTYYWYVVVNDSIHQTKGPTWHFHTSKAWDCNEDMNVNYLDASILVSNYGASGYLPGEIQADVIEDGAVNYLDVSSFVSHYGESY